MKLTNLKGKLFCIPHLNGLVPRLRYVGCGACELLIMQEKPEPTIAAPPAVGYLTTAEKLKRLRGGKRQKRTRTGPSDSPCHLVPTLKVSLESAFRKLWPLDERGFYRW